MSKTKETKAEAKTKETKADHRVDQILDALIVHFGRQKAHGKIVPVLDRLLVIRDGKPKEKPEKKEG